MNTPVNFISLNKTGKKRGRPKRPATETSESPEKKKIREDRAKDKKDENIEECDYTEGKEDEWGEEEIISMEQVTAETNEPVSRIQWENETLLWIIDAQFSINLLIDNTDNEDIKTLLRFFPPKVYR